MRVITEARELARLAIRPSYAPEYLRRWHLRRVNQVPRFQQFTTSVLGPPVVAVDSASFRASFDEIFGRQIYRFRCSRQRPFIIDGGANIGLSVIYFKQLHPSAEVVAFEPDPAIFAALRENVSAFKLRDVQLVQAALWKQRTQLDFFPEGADAGRLTYRLDQAHRCTVDGLRLRDYLDRPVDFLKLDVEGAELELLQDCADRLSCVERLFVEYHSFAGQRQQLDQLLGILTRAGMRYQIQTQLASKHPWEEAVADRGMDLQLNIFASRVATPKDNA